MIKILRSPLLLSILSGLFLALTWYEDIPNLTVFIGFVPLFIAIDRLFDKGLWRVILYSYIAFFTWNLLATWWIYNATLIGVILAILITATLMTIVVAGYYFVRKFAGKKTAVFGFIVFWISYEQFFHNSEITWPWLTLGNSLGNYTKLIQWYEYTGTLGGSLWILIVNFLVLALFYALITKTKRLIYWYSSFLLIVLIFPTIISYSIFKKYHEIHNPVNVVVVQPNIDPYNEKFNGLNNNQQLDIMLNLAEESVDSTTDYVVCPETAIDNRLWEHQLKNNSSIRRIKRFVDLHPRVKWITGMVSMRLFNSNESIPPTARKHPYVKNSYYDRYNSAIQIDTAFNLPIYHKSKLVVGVEMMPYPQHLRFLEKLSINLGGITGSLGTQPYRGVFKSSDDKFAVGPIICYESVFGEFVSGYVQNGANLLFVITNDGWWGDTPGYRQHLSYSRIRAIEMRRSIARSANTGISALVNQRGDVIDSIGWWKRGAIKGSVNANDKVTYYAQNGDYIGRLASFFCLLTLLYALSRFLMAFKTTSK